MKIYLNREELVNDFLKIPKLIFALLILSLGISLLREANYGLDAWGVLHDGISIQSSISFGRVSIIIGIVLVFISILFGVLPGIATILNVLLVGLFIDYISIIFNYFDIDSFILFLSGYVITNFGRALYISSNLGTGPRDGLYIVLSRITGKRIYFLKPAIEIFVIFIGLILGSKLGIGILIMTLFSGILIEYFFKLLRFNPSHKKASEITSYFKIKIS